MPLRANIYDLISLREAKVVISLNIKQRYEKKSRKSRGSYQHTFTTMFGSFIYYTYIYSVRNRKRHNFNDFVPVYTDTYTKEMDERGLKVLKWSMLDSPDSLGSAERFMERDTVQILDTVFYKERLKGYIHLGYTSKAYADRIGLGVNSEHRVGKAIKFKCINPSHRFRIVKGLIQYGVERIKLYDQSIYFDTENYLHKPELSFRHF